MEPFLEVGQLYRFLEPGRTKFFRDHCGDIGLLFYVKKVTRGVHWERIAMDEDSNDCASDWGWDFSLLVGEHEIHMFCRFEATIMATLEKIGSKQALNIG